MKIRLYFEYHSLTNMLNKLNEMIEGALYFEISYSVDTFERSSIFC